jgi:hypothetical protein
MKRFLVLYRAPVGAMEQMASSTPEQAQAGMEQWMAWSKRAGTALVDLGLPCGNAQTVGASMSGSLAAGYSIIQAASVAAARALFTDHPHLHMPGGSVEILELLPLPDMAPPKPKGKKR